MVQVTLPLCCLVDFLAHGLFPIQRKGCAPTPCLSCSWQHCSHQLISAKWMKKSTHLITIEGVSQSDGDGICFEHRPKQSCLKSNPVSHLHTFWVDKVRKGTTHGSCGVEYTVRELLNSTGFQWSLVEYLKLPSSRAASTSYVWLSPWTEISN